MSEITRDVDLASEFKVSVDVVHRYCKEHGVQQHKLRVGENVVIAFDREAFTKVVAPKIAADKQRQAKEPPEKGVGKEVLEAVERIGADAASRHAQTLNLFKSLGDLVEHHADVQAQVLPLADAADDNSAKAVELLEKVLQQQPLILRAINETRDFASQKFADLLKLIHGIDSAPMREAQEVAHSAPKAEAKPLKPVVMVVGLHQRERHHLDDEFSDAVEIHAVPPDEAEGSGFITSLQRAAAVFVMHKRLAQPSMRDVKASGVGFVRIDSNGISSLKDKITEFYATRT